MMTIRLFFLFLATLLSPLNLHADDNTAPVKILQQDQGRSYGVMVGDRIQHRYLLEVQSSYTLIPSSLPQAGALSYWLELNEVDISTKESADKTLYLIELNYQTFYAPLDVRSLNIPAIPLDFSADQLRYQVRLPDWGFTMSPIKEIVPSGVGNGNDVAAFMKPAIAPRMFSLAETNVRLLYLAIAAFFTLLALLWLSGFMPTLGRSPFVTAAREIRRIKRGGIVSTDDYLACLQVVHKAINHRSDTTVFSDQLEHFLDKHPQFKSLKAELAKFFACSRDAFFMDKRPDHSVITDCLLLCRQMAAADKVSAVK
jgi:mxaA protein